MKHRWLKSLNISMASERQQRKLAKEVVGGNIRAELAPFTFTIEKRRDEVREVPFVYRPNLMGAIGDLFAKHERY